jgi:hypothetical protein
VPEAEEEEDGAFAEPLEEVIDEFEAETHETESFAVGAEFEAATGEETNPLLDLADTTAIAVNQAQEPGNLVDELGDVYLDTREVHGGVEVTTVAELDPQGTLIQRFGTGGLQHGDAVAVESKTGSVLVADEASDKIDVFKLEPPGPPKVDGLSTCVEEAGCPMAKDVTPLRAEIDPEGEDTSYRFEYGTESCATEPSPCTATNETSIGSAFGDVAVSFTPENLAPGLYHYRVVAHNQLGTTVSGERTFSVSPAPIALPDGRAYEMVSPPHKNGAEPEAITEELGGGVIRSSTDGSAITYITDGPVPANTPAEGSRSPEPTQVISTRDPVHQEWVTRDISTPTESGAGILVGSAAEYQLFSRNLSIALVEPFPNSPEHEESTFAAPPLSPPASEAERNLQQEGKPYQEKTFYLRASESIEPEEVDRTSYEQARKNGEAMKPIDAGFLPLVTSLNAPGGEPFGGEGPPGEGGGGERQGVQSESATPDLTYGVFKAFRGTKPGIYEWGPGGAIEPVSLLPESQGGTLVTPQLANLGSVEERDVNHAISEDGVLVFWSTVGHLYVRDMATKQTLELDVPQEGVKVTGAPTASFQTASASGSRVFFTDEQGLTADARANTDANARATDLYVAELSGGRGQAGEGPLTFTLKNLTPSGLNDESAEVQGTASGGGVIGASEGGEYVYFVANGVLAPGATRGFCSTEEEPRPPGTTCNLYVSHLDGTEWTTKFVTPLSYEDNPDWGIDFTPGDLTFVTSRVSPSGQYLAFMSDLPLTGYDNVDQSARAKGARDEEVFEYNTASEDVTCVSCNPSGEPPEGVFDPGVEKFEGEPEHEGRDLLVDRSQIWGPENSDAAHWLAANVPGWSPEYINRALLQPRYLLDDGRVFFNSPDHLVPAAAGTKEKVYEYEPGGTGSCESDTGCIGLISGAGLVEREAAFLEASVSGNDVFFLTAEALLPQDLDSNFDIYDARVCEAESPCLQAQAGGGEQCANSDQCRPGSTSATPPVSAPTTANSSSSGNLAQQQVLPTKEEKPKPATKPKPPTRAQLLAKALKLCKRDKQKARRIACEKQAHKRYGPKGSAHKSSTGEHSSRQGAR